MEVTGNSSSKKRTADKNSNTSQESISSSTKEGVDGWDVTWKGEDIVFTRKDLSQPGFDQFKVHRNTFNSLKTGQELPTGIPGYCLLKKNSHNWQVRMLESLLLLS